MIGNSVGMGLSEFVQSFLDGSSLGSYCGGRGMKNGLMVDGVMSHVVGVKKGMSGAGIQSLG